MLVALNRRLAGVLAVSDPVKPEAADVVAGLKAQGIRCCLLTGDGGGGWQVSVDGDGHTVGVLACSQGGTLQFYYYSIFVLENVSKCFIQIDEA